MAARKSNDLIRWQTIGSQNKGRTASIKDSIRTYETAVVIDVCSREDPGARVCTKAGQTDLVLQQRTMSSHDVRACRMDAKMSTTVWLI